MDLITITHQKDSTFKAQIRDHSFLSDMAVGDGGHDEAPSPAELLVCSLGMCIGMTINTYCTSHGYDSEDVEVSMTYLLEDNPKRIKNITVDIALPENFPSNRKTAILNSLKSCVIFNSLNKNTEIDIEFED